MNIFTLFGKIALEGLDQAEKQLNDLEGFVKKNSAALKAMGVAFTAVGVAGLAVISSTKKINAGLGQTALTLGITTKEMRNLTLAVTDVTFSIGSVAKTFELLAKAGIRDINLMQQSAKAFDALADATGSSAEVIADLLLPAFKLFGEEIPQTSAELDKFTWLTKSTLVDLSDFGTLLTRMAPYMDDLSMSMDDAIATLAALGEQGIVGTAATLKLRTAITQAASGTVTLNEALGLTQEEIDGFKTKMSEAAGMTDAYAETANTQFTIMDKLKQKWSELTLKASGFLEPLEPVLAGMTALGPVMIFFSTSMGAAAIKTAAHTASLVAHKIATVATIIATGAWTAAQWLLNAALTANPIGLIIAGVAALTAGVIALWRNWDKVVSFFTRKTKEMAVSTQDEVKKQTAALDSLGASAKKNADIAIEALRKKYGVLEDLGKKENQTLMDLAREASVNRKTVIDKELDDYKDAYDYKIGLIDSEYNARITLLDHETDAAVKAINDQIKNINRQVEEERDAETERRLRDALVQANFKGSIEDRKIAQKELDDFLKEQSRNTWIETLENQKDAILSNAEDQKRGYQEELETKTTQETSLYNATMKRLTDEKALLDEHLKYKLGLIEQERRAEEQLQTDLLKMLTDRLVLERAVLEASSGLTPAGEPQLSPPKASWWLRNFDIGGVVPGAIGQPVPIMAHGGETITPPGRSNITNQFNISQLVVREEADIYKISKQLYRLQQARI